MGSAEPSTDARIIPQCPSRLVNDWALYEILGLLGSGGMGEVYRARDTKLHRDVALKVLPDSFAQDPDRIARFSREARVLASLNHPHIAQIHGLEESDGVRALVMELVEGPTLADRLAQGPVPIDEALPIARQIADALETAHEQGIIHRDLKPANIKVREDGTVKVLDFGLAKALEPIPAAGAEMTASPTMTSPAMTGMGVILGTAAYMSPEQTRGKPLDKRTDIWAFGCVLYEMLAGRRAFGGDTVPTRSPRSSGASRAGTRCRLRHRRAFDDCSSVASRKIRAGVCVMWATRGSRSTKPWRRRADKRRHRRRGAALVMSVRGGHGGRTAGGHHDCGDGRLVECDSTDRSSSETSGST